MSNGRALEQVDRNSDHERKKSDMLVLLERLVDEVNRDRLFGEFTVSFSAQGGRISHYEEFRRRTFK